MYTVLNCSRLTVQLTAQISLTLVFIFFHVMHLIQASAQALTVNFALGPTVIILYYTVGGLHLPWVFVFNVKVGDTVEFPK